MADLTTKYMGLTLKNPVIVASGPLTKTPEKAQECEAAGAGAVVLKSIFEEQINQETDGWHMEMFGGMGGEYAMRYGTAEYLETIKMAKKNLSIPVIASVNCKNGRNWDTFSQDLQDNGADAIELNIGIMPDDLDEAGASIENRIIEIVQSVRKSVTIPVAVKIGQNFSSIPNIVNEISNAGADAIVMFNRFFRSTIDIDTLKIKPCQPYSDEAEADVALRWIALTAGRIDSYISASSGLHNSERIIKAILAGASTAQILTCLFKNDLNYIRTILAEMEQWMDKHGFATINDFKGKFSVITDDDAAVFGRLQYMKALGGPFKH